MRVVVSVNRKNEKKAMERIEINEKNFLDEILKAKDPKKNDDDGMKS